MKKRRMKSWLVPCEVRLQGWTVVEAEDAIAARQRVDSGDFNIEHGAETVDWKAIGEPEVNE